VEKLRSVCLINMSWRRMGCAEGRQFYRNSGQGSFMV